MDKILLFIPMYNCEKQITRVLNQVDSLNEKYLSGIIIVNNRSTDNGEEVVLDYIEKRKFNIPVKLLRNDQNYNLGGSHKVAFDYAIKNNYDYVIVLHGDDQGSINDVIKVIKNGEYKKHDAMLGSRFLKESKIKGYSTFRIIGNRVFNIIYTIFLGKKIKDLGSGLNMYKVDILKDKFYFKYPDRLTFNCFMLLGHKYYHHDICFFPISWREEDQASNVKMISQSWQTFKLAFMYFIRKGKFLNSEHRNTIIDDYTAKEIKKEVKKETLKDTKKEVKNKKSTKKTVKPKKVVKRTTNKGGDK